MSQTLSQTSDERALNIRNLSNSNESILVNDVKFVNISISSLGVFAKESSNFLKMPDDIGFEDKHKIYYIRKMMTIAIRTSYYIFCCRDKGVIPIYYSFLN